MAHNCEIVKDALSVKEMHRSLTYIVLISLMVPRFDEFLYYFKTGPAGFSQFTYSILTLIGTVCLVVGIAIY